MGARIKKQTLKQKGEEAQVQAHLFNLELKSQVELLRKGFHIVKRNLLPLKPVWDDSMKRVRVSANPFIKSLKATLMRTRDQIKEVYHSKSA